MESNDFLDSRYEFVYNLGNQVSINTGKPLYKASNTIARAALLGVAKEEIVRMLENDPTFVANKNLLDNFNSIEDTFEKAKLLDFKDFYESLQAMRDPETPTSIRRELSSVLSKYQDTDTALYELENGATAKEIFEALKESKSWTEDAQDFLSRGYVELPTNRQRARWLEFGKAVDLINDLKYLN